MEVRKEVAGNKIIFIIAGGLLDVLARLFERRNVGESSVLEFVYFLKSVREIQGFWRIGEEEG